MEENDLSSVMLSFFLLVFLSGVRACEPPLLCFLECRNFFERQLFHTVYRTMTSCLDANSWATVDTDQTLFAFCSGDDCSWATACNPGNLPPPAENPQQPRAQVERTVSVSRWTARDSMISALVELGYQIHCQPVNGWCLSATGLLTPDRVFAQFVESTERADGSFTDFTVLAVGGACSPGGPEALANSIADRTVEIAQQRPAFDFAPGQPRAPPGILGSEVLQTEVDVSRAPELLVCSGGRNKSSGGYCAIRGSARVVERLRQQQTKKDRCPGPGRPLWPSPVY
jgi:hypothetical protein